MVHFKIIMVFKVNHVKRIMIYIESRQKIFRSLYVKNIIPYTSKKIKIQYIFLISDKTIQKMIKGLNDM